MTTTTTTSASKTKLRVAVLGGGRLGAAVCALLARAQMSVVLWTRNPAQRQKIAETLRIDTADSVEAACRDAEVVFFAVPTPALREVAQHVGNVARGDQIALHASRGVEPGFVLPHAIIRQETCLQRIGVLGGPLYLDDATAGRPLVAVVASRFGETVRVVQALTRGTRVRIHPSHDVVGVEVAGAVSFVSQIAAGIAEGAGLGETDQGILLTRGLAEAQALGVHLGAERTTFTGLAGVGDLIPRPVTSTRKHRELGSQIGKGGEVHLGLLSGLEGPKTAREAAQLARRLGVAVPLIAAVDAILHESKPPAATLEDVLGLDLELDTSSSSSSSSSSASGAS